MIYWLSDIRGPVLDQSVGLTPGIHAVENFGSAGYFGQHLVLGHRPDLVALSVEPRLSERARVYFRSTAERLTELAGLSRVASVVQVSGEVLAPVERGGTWHVPIGNFSDPDALLPSCLVAEDENDLRLLSEFARVWTEREVKSCKLSLRFMPGGGSNTFKVLRRQFRDHKNPVICIVDSDRDLPGGSPKSTAENCEAVFRSDSVAWRDALHVLQARELENLLPKTLVQSLVANSRNEMEKAERLNSINRDIADYVDMKIGERLCRFHELNQESPSHARVLVGLEATSVEHAGFTGLEICRGDASCAIVPLLGENSLMRAAEILNARASRLDHPHQSWHEELRAICKLIFSSCAALPRVAV